MKMKLTLLATCLTLTGLADPLAAQSQTASDASAVSMHLSVHATAATLEAIPAGSALIVSALRPAGELVELTVVSAATGASFVVDAAASVVSSAAITTGTAIVVSAVGSGWLILVGSEAIAFVPNAIARSLIGHRVVS